MTIESVLPYKKPKEGASMKISQRALSLTTSPIRRLGPYALEAEKAGKKVYHLNIGQPDIETPAQFMDAIRSFDKKVVAYGPSQGDPKLIAQVQKYYEAWGMHYEAKNIYITNGGSEALELAALALCDPGDEILVFEPFYANYNSFAKISGAHVKAVPTHAENGYRLPDAATVEQYVSAKTRAILLTNPGNPTGVVYTKEEMDMVAGIVKKHALLSLRMKYTANSSTTVRTPALAPTKTSLTTSSSSTPYRSVTAPAGRVSAASSPRMMNSPARSISFVRHASVYRKWSRSAQLLSMIHRSLTSKRSMKNIRNAVIPSLPVWQPSRASFPLTRRGLSTSW